MKTRTLLATMLLAAAEAGAQTADPVLMTVGGRNVTRSEFEYSYNKNSGQDAIDRKTPAEYAQLFADYKLKVRAAEDAGIDTTRAFREEFAQYRDMQIRPSFATDSDIEAEARKIYNATQLRIDAAGGMAHVQHILVAIGQQATKAQQEAARQRADSIYQALQQGADMADMARRTSDDRASAQRGGFLAWIQRGQTVKEFEDKAFGTPVGQTTRPFLSPSGYHIARVAERRNCPPYDSLRTGIMQYIERRGLRQRIIQANIDSLARQAKPQLTPQQVVDRRAEQMQAADPELRGLIREYHDGLLLYEIANRTVWQRAASDTKALEAFFKRNRKRYAWDRPRFKGIAFYTKSEADAQAVRRLLKKVPFEQWADTIARHFNTQSIRVKAVRGIFKQGDNALVDRMHFGRDTTTAIPDGYAVEATYGKTLKAPKTYTDVRQLVTADMQEQMERQWVEALRRRYEVRIYSDVLDTVNKH